MDSTDPAGALLERLRPVFETALDAVVAMNAAGLVVEWNMVAERTFGWTRQEAIGKPMVDLIVPPQHRSAHIAGVERYNRTGQGSVLGQRLEITALCRDGNEIPVELSITVTETVGGKIFVGFLRDISERKQSEALLIRQAREANLLFRISRLAAENVSVELVLKATLEAICELARWPIGHALILEEGRPDELVSTGIWHAAKGHSFEPLKLATEKIRFRRGVGLPGLILETGEPAWMADTENEEKFARKEIHGAAFGFPLQSAGRVIAVLEFFTPEKSPPDTELLLTVRTLGEQLGRALERSHAIAQMQELNETLEQRVLDRTSELELAHEALRQSQKLEAIGQLTGGIAHDFNNFLTVIRGSADLLRQPQLNEEKRKRYMDAISDTADRAARLTGQLLAFARRQALKPEVFDVSQRIGSIRDMIRTIVGGRVTLIVDADCSDCFVEADAAQFETALVNLVVNARDAMSGEGTLSIAVRIAENQDQVAVTVSDTGEGISSDQLDRIFEPFYTTKEAGKGTGLGLSQVYGFIKQSGGELEVQSQVGAGTRFTLSFPRAEARRTDKNEDGQPSSHVPDGSRILIVEDNAEVGQFAFQLVSDLGYEATLAPNAAEALDHLERRADEFDIVFSDVVMPGMNGVEFGTRVRDRWPWLPVILTTGYSHQMAQEPGHGFVLLHKPYSADALSRAIRDAIGQRALTQR